MLKELNWDPLVQRRKHSRPSMMYKIRNNRVDINAAKFLQSGDARTRGQDRLFQERIKDQILSNSWWSNLTRSSSDMSTVYSFNFLTLRLLCTTTTKNPAQYMEAEDCKARQLCMGYCSRQRNDNIFSQKRHFSLIYISTGQNIVTPNVNKQQPEREINVENKWSDL